MTTKTLAITAFFALNLGLGGCVLGPVTPDDGTFSGSGVSFTVSGDGTEVSWLELSFSTYLTGSYCSASVSGSVETSPNIAIVDGQFSYDSGSLYIDGEFDSAGTATGYWEYSTYDSYCGGTISDSGEYYAELY